MSHRGPAGLPRPMVNCQPDAAFEIDEAYPEERKREIEDEISNQTDVSVSVQEGVSFDNGTTDVIFDLSGSNVDEEEFEELRSILRTIGLPISGWRIGVV